MEKLWNVCEIMDTSLIVIFSIFVLMMYKMMSRKYKDDFEKRKKGISILFWLAYSQVIINILVALILTIPLISEYGINGLVNNISGSASLVSIVIMEKMFEVLFTDKKENIVIKVYAILILCISLIPIFYMLCSYTHMYEYWLSSLSANVFINS